MELLTEWGVALQGHLDGYLASGSPLAILVAYAAGLVTSLTPCVYPMIPVVVTFMAGAAQGSRARALRLSAVYVGGMAVVYAALGVAAATFGLRFGDFSRTPWVYFPVAIFIGLMGLSMLDVLTIPIPGFAGTMQSKGVSRGGWLGALIMGVASGFVAAPCSAPVLALLLVWVAKTRNVVWGGTLMLAFSLGLGTLLLLLGTSSGLITALPKAGPWMSAIKKVCGILMLLIAVGFAIAAVRM